MNENLAMKIRRTKKENPKKTKKKIMKNKQVDNIKFIFKLVELFFVCICECYLQCDIMMQRCEHNHNDLKYNNSFFFQKKS